MENPERLECCDKTFDTEQEFKEHRQESHKRALPMWCRGIMGGCVNCGGCI